MTTALPHLTFSAGACFGIEKEVTMNDVIFDVDQQEFNEKVVTASLEKTVVVDFWAAWCAPCKMLGPVLEKVVRSFGGNVLLAKVDIDKNQAIATQLGIRSIPTVKIIKDGAIVQDFVGVLPEEQIRAMLEAIVGDAQGGDDLAAAEQLAEEGRYDEASAIYEAVLAEDPKQDKAVIGLARVAIKRGDAESARARLSAIDELSDAYDEAKALLTGLDFLTVCGTVDDRNGLAGRFEADRGDLEAGYSLGCCYAAEGKYREAFETFLAVIARDRDYGDGKARNAMLSLFGIVGQESDLTGEFRRKLANVLF